MANNDMNEAVNAGMLMFDSPKDQSSYIKVIGVGGGGNNAVNHMFRKGIKGVDFIVSNTDMKALNGSPVPNKLALGHEGLGVGGRPEKARKAALEMTDEIKALFEHNTKMVFITAGMGGGTGTGAAPVVAEVAKSIKLQAEEEDDQDRILVVAVVTTPFSYEGNRRIQQANSGIDELRKHVDSILVINNDKLRSFGNLSLSNAFGMANDVLLTAVKGIAEIITLNAYVNIDFRDVNTVMQNSGTALMGIGEGTGESRALDAVRAAATSVLLNDNDIAGAKNALLYFSYSPDHELTMDEMGAVTDYVCEKTGSLDTNIIWGAGADDSLGEELRITLIATGFEAKEDDKPRRIELPETVQAPRAVVAPVQPESVVEPVLIHREEPVVAPVEAKPMDIEQPATTAEVQPLNETRRVIMLEDEPAPVKAEAPAHVMPSDDGIRLVSAEPQMKVETVASIPAMVAEESSVAVAVEAPVAETYRAPEANFQPAAQPQRMPYQQPVNYQPRPDHRAMEMKAMSRAERIKAMHDMLCNTPDGAERVESMTIEQLTGDAVFDTQVSSARSEVAKRTIGRDGSIVENPYLYSNPD